MLIFLFVILAAFITIVAPFAWWINIIAGIGIALIVIWLIRHFDVALALVWAAIKWVLLGGALWLIIHFLT